MESALISIDLWKGRESRPAGGYRSKGRNITPRFGERAGGRAWKEAQIPLFPGEMVYYYYLIYDSSREYARKEIVKLQRINDCNEF